MAKAKRRPKGEGSITVLPNGKLKMTITLGTGADGKQKRKAVTAETKDDLMEKVAVLRVKYKQATKSQRNYHMTFETLVNMYKDEIQDIRSDGTKRNMKTADKFCLVHLYPYDVDKITADDIDYVLDNIRKINGDKYSNTTISMFKERIAAIFNYAIDKEIISVSPLRKTKRRPRASHRVDTVEIPSEEELRQILEYTKDYDKRHKEEDVPLYPLFLLAVSTGARLGELLDIDRVKSIDIKKSCIDLKTQLTFVGSGQPLKNKWSRRIIYVDPDVLNYVLNSVPASPKTTKLWVFRDKQVVYPTIARRIANCLTKCPYAPKGFTFHCFRHYHATQLLLKGIDVKEVSKRLGHKSIKTTLDSYAHWIPEMDMKAAATVGNQYIL